MQPVYCITIASCMIQIAFLCVELVIVCDGDEGIDGWRRVHIRIGCVVAYSADASKYMYMYTEI